MRTVLARGGGVPRAASSSSTVGRPARAFAEGRPLEAQGRGLLLLRRCRRRSCRHLRNQSRRPRRRHPKHASRPFRLRGLAVGAQNAKSSVWQPRRARARAAAAATPVEAPTRCPTTETLPELLHQGSVAATNRAEEALPEPLLAAPARAPIDGPAKNSPSNSDNSWDDSSPTMVILPARRSRRRSSDDEGIHIPTLGPRPRGRRARSTPRGLARRGPSTTSPRSTAERPVACRPGTSSGSGRRHVVEGDDGDS